MHLASWSGDFVAGWSEAQSGIAPAQSSRIALLSMRITPRCNIQTARSRISEEVEPSPIKRGFEGSPAEALSERALRPSRRAHRLVRSGAGELQVDFHVLLADNLNIDGAVYRVKGIGARRCDRQHFLQRKCAGAGEEVDFAEPELGSGGALEETRNPRD